VNVIICGSREFLDFKFMYSFLDKFFDKLMDVEKIQKEDIKIYCGKARGADCLGEQWGKMNSIESIPFPAKWDTDGKFDRGAGIKRNAEMVETADITIAFFDNVETNGTSDTIKRSVKKGIPVVVLKNKKIHQKFNFEKYSNKDEENDETYSGNNTL